MSIVGSGAQSQPAGRNGKRTVLVVVVLLAVLVFAPAVFLSLSGRPVSASAGTASASRSCTVTGKASTPRGSMTVCVRYSATLAGHLHVRSVVASYRSHRGYPLPHFTVTLIDEATGRPDDHLSGRLLETNGSRSYRTKFTALRPTFSGAQMLIVTLMALNPNRDEQSPLISVAIELSRKRFPCPAPETEGSGTKTIPIC